jgi:hypothetical protein
MMTTMVMKKSALLIIGVMVKMIKLMMVTV